VVASTQTRNRFPAISGTQSESAKENLRVGAGKDQRKNRPASDLAHRDRGRPEQQSQPVIAAVRAETHFSGPVPPPDVLAEYARLIPGAPDRILAMAEREQDHRHRSQVLLLGIADRESRSQRIGLYGCIGIMAVLLMLIYLAMPHGAVVVSLVVVVLIGFMVFMGVGMYRRRDGSQSFKAKADKGGLSVESKNAADKPTSSQP
jgi:uncharacterized membrane protein